MEGLTGFFEEKYLEFLHQSYFSEAEQRVISNGRYLPSKPWMIGSLVADAERLITFRKSKILDLGSGHGFTMAAFALHECKVYGIEDKVRRENLYFHFGKAPDIYREQYEDFEGANSNPITPEEYEKAYYRVTDPIGFCRSRFLELGLAEPQVMEANYYDPKIYENTFADGTRIQDIDFFHCDAVRKVHARYVIAKVLAGQGKAREGSIAFVGFRSDFIGEHHKKWLEGIGFESIRPYFVRKVKSIEVDSVELSLLELTCRRQYVPGI